jgi:hypothetical protein
VGCYMWSTTGSLATFFSSWPIVVHVTSSVALSITKCVVQCVRLHSLDIINRFVEKLSVAYIVWETYVNHTVRYVLFAMICYLYVPVELYFSVFITFSIVYTVFFWKISS